MDLIYGTAPAGRELSPLGGMLYGYEFDSPCFQSVRTRRATLAREIDDMAATRPGARVLSVACGHLCEIEWSRAARDGRASIVALADAMFRMLAPGGRLLIATFTPDTGDAAFMEAFMDWHLVYRTEAEMRGVAESIPASDVEDVAQCRDEIGNITYLRLVRR